MVYIFKFLCIFVRFKMVSVLTTVVTNRLFCIKYVCDMEHGDVMDESKILNRVVLGLSPNPNGLCPQVRLIELALSQHD